MSIHPTRETPTRKSTITRHPPTASCFERAETFGVDGVTCQRTLVSNSLNDEERSDGLSNPTLYQTTCPEIGSRESTNLGRREDGYEEIRNGVVVCAHWSKNQE